MENNNDYNEEHTPFDDWSFLAEFGVLLWVPLILAALFGY